MNTLERAVLATLPHVPKPVMRRFASPYIAGETLEEAIAELARLQGLGFPGILDVLGEDVADEAEARAALATYRDGATAIQGAGLDSYVSVKPTHFGLRLSRELCASLYEELCTHCAELGVFVRVEMEDRTTTDDTLDLFRSLRARFTNVGVVLQARLHRTADDIAALPDDCDVRMVKGIYLEPAEVAHTERSAIRDAFVELTNDLLRRGHTVAVASHDDEVVERVLAQQKELGIADERTYWEVLKGVRPKMWDALRARGQTVRVYLPYGPDWKAYSLRRFKENPEILRHVMKAALPFG
ncbi:MAG: proline dehydrogenase family protein [Planctomycetota bacterium]